jgi:elongation factor Tu
MQKPVQESVDVAETSDAKGPFEMAVADVFNITGQGVVVTGRVKSGSISVGESVCIAGGSPVTVKGIEMMRKTLESISAGDMGGLMLEGISKDDISKGDVVRSCD